MSYDRPQLTTVCASVPSFIKWLPELSEWDLHEVLENEDLHQNRYSVIRRAISRLVAMKAEEHRRYLEYAYGRKPIDRASASQNDR